MTYIPSVETSNAFASLEGMEALAMLLSVLTAYLTVILVIAVALAALLIAANWRIFSKAGTGGWKALIPVYNTYTLYKIAWKKRYFFISLVLMLLAYLVPPYVVMLLETPQIAEILRFLPLILTLIVVIIEIKMHIKLAKAFRKRGGFAVGLILLPFIFFPILGFGPAKYRKRKRRKKKALPPPET